MIIGTLPRASTTINRGRNVNTKSWKKLLMSVNRSRVNYQVLTDSFAVEYQVIARRIVIGDLTDFLVIQPFVEPSGFIIFRFSGCLNHYKSAMHSLNIVFRMFH